MQPWAEAMQVNVWEDSHIKAGQRWDDEIRDYLHRADIVLLLLSPDFLTSRYINETELKIIFERRDQGECLVVPILLRQCHWYQDKRILETAMLPKEKKSQELKSICELLGRKNNVFYEISDKIKKSATDIQKGEIKLHPRPSNHHTESENPDPWRTFFTQYPPKENDNISPLMTVRSDREESYTKRLRPHFDKHKNDPENLVYFISACPKQNPSSIAKRLVYFFEDDFTEFFRNDRYTNELEVIRLNLASTKTRTWGALWKVFQDRFLKKEVDFERFVTNPAEWLERQNRVALVFEIEGNDLGDATDFAEQICFILQKFERLSPNYRKFVFFFVFKFPDLHERCSSESQAQLACLDAIVSDDKILREETPKLHIDQLLPVAETDVESWAHSFLETTHVDFLLDELRQNLPHNRRKMKPLRYDMYMLEEMQYAAYKFYRDPKN